MHGSQKDLLPGEPNLAPSSAVIVESYITLLRKLHATNTWTEEVNLQILLLLFQNTFRCCFRLIVVY